MAAAPKAIDIKAKFDISTESPLIQAADKGDLKTLSDLVSPENVDTPASNGLTPLYFAVGSNHKDAVSFLLSKGANANVQINCGSTIKFYRNSKGEEIHYGALFTPLMMSIKPEGLEIFILLVETGKADIDQTDATKNSALHYASKRDILEIVQYLFETRLKIEAEKRKLLAKRDRYGNTPLMVAETERMVRYLVGTGCVDINQENFKRETAIHLFSRTSDYLDTLKYLIDTYGRTSLERERLLEKPDIDGNTPFLTSASRGGCLEIVDYYLTTLKVDVTQANSKRETALHLISQYTERDDLDLINEGVEIIKSIFSTCTRAYAGQKALLEKRDVAGNTPFLAAVYGGTIEIVQHYVEALEVDLEQINLEQKTALILAVERNHQQIVSYLLGRGARLPIHFSNYAAIMKSQQNIKHTEEMRTILAAADDLIQFAEGWVTMQSLSEILKSGASLNQKMACGTTPLHIAAGNGYEKQVEELLEAGADTTIKDDTRSTAAMSAEFSGHMSVVAKILFFEIKKYLKNNDNKNDSKKTQEEIQREMHVELEKLFEAAGRVSHLERQALLYLNLGRQFKELTFKKMHFNLEAKRALESIPETSSSFQAAQGELMDIIEPIDPASLNATGQTNDTKEKADIVSNNLLNRLAQGYKAGLMTSFQAQSLTCYSAFRTQWLNDFFGVPIHIATATTSTAASPALIGRYADPCSPFGLLQLTKEHHKILQKCNMLAEQNKKQAEEMDKLRIELARSEGRSKALEEVVFNKKKRKISEAESTSATSSITVTTKPSSSNTNTSVPADKEEPDPKKPRTKLI